MRRLLNQTQYRQANVPCGESQMWIACVELGVRDWQRGLQQLATTYSFSPARAREELRWLRWFLFSKEPEEFNLEWIAESIFITGDYATTIRKNIGPLGAWWDEFKVT